MSTITKIKREGALDYVLVRCAAYRLIYFSFFVHSYLQHNHGRGHGACIRQCIRCMKGIHHKYAFFFFFFLHSLAIPPTMFSHRDESARKHCHLSVPLKGQHFFSEGEGKEAGEREKGDLCAWCAVSICRILYTIVKWQIEHPSIGGSRCKCEM